MEQLNETSTIVLNRKKRFTFGLTNVEVSLNGSKVALLKNGSSESRAIPAGTHTLTIIPVGFGSMGAQSNHMMFVAQAGESYSFVIEPSEQRFTIVLSGSSESFKKKKAIETSTIVLNRKKTFIFGLTNVEVSLNGSKVALLKNGNSESRTIPAGTHTLTIIPVGFGSMGAQSNHMMFVAQAGESYSFVIEPSEQGFTIVLSGSSESFKKATLESVPSTQTEAVKQEQPLEPNDAQPLGLVESEEQQIFQEQPELQDKVQANSNPMDLDDEHYYLEVEQEIFQSRLDDALWSKCVALAEDNPMEALSLYRKERVKRLKKGIKVETTTNPLPAINYQGCLKPFLGFVSVIVILNLFWSYQDYQEEQRRIEDKERFLESEKKVKEKLRYDEERTNPAYKGHRAGCRVGLDGRLKISARGEEDFFEKRVLTTSEIYEYYDKCMKLFKGKKYLYGPDS